MRALVLPLLLAPALAVSGCSDGAQSINRGVESVNQPVVARQDYAFDVRTGYDGLADGEAGRLAGWFDALRIGYGDRVTLDGGLHGGLHGGPSGHDAVARVTARYGLLLGDRPPVTDGEIAAGTVRVVVSRSTAFVPDCPNWSTASQPYATGATDHNYGCATNTNLAAMIADPQDLIAGRHGSPSLSTRAATRALKAYNELVPTGVAATVKAETTGGK